MAQQLLHPGVLDEGLRSALFISGVRRTGKTTFLQADLVPALEAAGALVMDWVALSNRYRAAGSPGCRPAAKRIGTAAAGRPGCVVADQPEHALANP